MLLPVILLVTGCVGLWFYTGSHSFLVLALLPVVIYFNYREE